MKLAQHPALDALCGEYLIGTLRGASRRRLQRALIEEPAVARRVDYWVRRVSVSYSDKIALQPRPASWTRLKRELELHRYAPRWHARVGLWRGWALAATAALVLIVPFVPFVQSVRRSVVPPVYSTVALLQGKTAAADVTVQMSADRRLLRLSAARPVQASPTQSFELWLLPAGGAAPVSLAVLGSLDTEVLLPVAQAPRLAEGAKLAVSLEPAGGSPTGAPTGAVILIGAVQT